MKRLILSVLILSITIGFSGCGGGGGGNSTPPNNNTYNLRTVNKITGLSALLKGGYSNGTKGSLSLAKLDDGTDIINVRQWLYFTRIYYRIN